MSREIDRQALETARAEALNVTRAGGDGFAIGVAAYLAYTTPTPPPPSADEASTVDAMLDAFFQGRGWREWGNAEVYRGRMRAAMLSMSKGGSFDLVQHLHRQRDFSLRTFGPGIRTAGVCDHIRKELREIDANPTDLMEWIDVVMLGLDGAWRPGHGPEEIAAALAAKLEKNIARTWPDWRTADPNKAIEHVKVSP